MGNRQHLVGLDFARFAACCAVMVFHLAFWSWISTNTTPGRILGGVAKYPELISISWWGRIGVDVFFTISGFVIAYSASTSSAVSFLRGRFLRLFPAALICATATLLVRLYFNPESWRAFSWLYWNSITFDLFGGWIDGSYWTLGIEVTFYFTVFFFIAAGLVRYIEWLAAVMLIVTAVKVTQLSGILAFDIVLTERVQQLLMLYHGAAFAIGVFAWAGVFRGWNAWRAVAIIASVGVAGYSVYYQTIGLAKMAGRAPFIATAIWLLVISIIIVSAVYDKQISARLGDRAKQTARILGLATYPLYLIHDAVGAHMLRVMVDSGFNRYVSLVIVILSMIAMSTTLLLVTEEWLRLKIRTAVDTAPDTRKAEITNLPATPPLAIRP